MRKSALCVIESRTNSATQSDQRPSGSLSGYVCATFIFKDNKSYL